MKAQFTQIWCNAGETRPSYWPGPDIDQHENGADKSNVRHKVTLIRSVSHLLFKQTLLRMVESFYVIK